MTPTAARALRAVVFDVDGTLAETERDGHRPAFNRAFRDHGLPYEWGVTEYGRLLSITGGRRRLAGYLAERGHDAPDALARDLHLVKTAHFLAWVRRGPVLARPGVPELLTELHDRGIALGVATTGSRDWVTVLLGRLFPGVPFDVVVTGEDVGRLKPDPEAYLKALSALGVGPEQAMAVEDSPPGLAAAVGAGLPCLVVCSGYHRGLPFPGAAAVVPGYQAMDMFDTKTPGYLAGGITADALRRLHSAAR